MKVLHLNCRSLLPKWDEINLTLLSSGFDVLVLSETWLHSNISDSLIHNKNYNLIRLDRKVTLPSGITKKGGGLCMYIRNNITIEQTQCLPLSDGDIEIMHVNLKKGFECRINVIGVYRPPNGNLTSGLEKLKETLKEIKQNCKGESIILGDFNIDYRNSKDRGTTKLREIFEDFWLTQIIDSVTRKTARQETMIDLIFTDLRFIHESGVIEMSLSDHYLTFITKKKERNNKCNI